MNWQQVLLLSINTLGLIEWIKGFINKFKNTTIEGNATRILQLIVCFILALVSAYLPTFVQTAITTLSITTLYKTEISSAGKAMINKILGGNNDNKTNDIISSAATNSNIDNGNIVQHNSKAEP